jgi:ABC-type protease/lipase transport system fused ATPase/permease subunit
MADSNIDIYLEQLRQEFAQAWRVRHEQKRITAAHCARIHELVSELEEVYVTIFNIHRYEGGQK